MKNKRGAQPGNKNAFWHGLYTAAHRAHQAGLLEQVPAADLSAEIKLIRIMNVRSLEALKAGPPTLDLAARTSALRALGLSIHALASLLRLQSLAVATEKDSNALRDSLLAPIPACKEEQVDDGEGSLSSVFVHLPWCSSQGLRSSGYPGRARGGLNLGTSARSSRRTSCHFGDLNRRSMRHQSSKHLNGFQHFGSPKLSEVEDIVPALVFGDPAQAPREGLNRG